MPDQPAFTPPPFEQSGLPQEPMVQRAYELVKHIPRAVGSAQALAEMLSLEDIVAAHLVAFVNDPRIPLTELARDYSLQVADDVKDIRRIYDEKLELRKSGTSAAVEASFMACAIWDTDELMKQMGPLKLRDGLMSTMSKGGKLVILQTDVEHHLRQHRRELEDVYLHLAELSGIPSIEARLRKSLQALELKIAMPEAPDTPAPQQAAAPKRKGPRAQPG